MNVSQKTIDEVERAERLDAEARERIAATEKAEFAEFHNRLRLLLNIDCWELEEAGVIKKGDRAAWNSFMRDPHRWFIQVNDETAEKLWALMQTRMKP